MGAACPASSRAWLAWACSTTRQHVSWGSDWMSPGPRVPAEVRGLLGHKSGRPAALAGALSVALRPPSPLSAVTSLQADPLRPESTCAAPVSSHLPRGHAIYRRLTNTLPPAVGLGVRGQRQGQVIPSSSRPGAEMVAAHSGCGRGTHRALCPSSCGSSRVPMEPRRPGGHSDLPSHPSPSAKWGCTQQVLRKCLASTRKRREGEAVVPRLYRPLAGSWREALTLTAGPGLRIPHQ